MRKLKKEHRNKILSNASVKKFNTNDIEDNMIAYYTRMGFGYLFEAVCYKCEQSKCKCKKITKKNKEDK